MSADAAHWRLAAASAIGSSHREFGQPCQDAAAAELATDACGQCCLVACVADGAGSAALAELGAQAACASLVEGVRHWWCDPGRGALDEDSLQFLVALAATALQRLAQVQQVERRALACTVLLAVVTPHGAGFAQIGDGAMVFAPTGSAAPEVAFWPESGEYANLTCFLTDDDWRAHLQLRCVAPAPARLALFSDGLQRLALRLAERVPHAPFFAPLWQALADSAPGARAGFDAQLAEWLGSAALEQRTDDDKSLVLAVRSG